jgi:hypothetical protein
MVWPQTWSLNAARQRSNVPAGLDGQIMALEEWRDNHVTPWGQRADDRLQKLENDLAGHGKQIKDLEEQGERIDNLLRQNLPGMENRINALEGEMGKVEKACRVNSQGASELRKDMSKTMKNIDSRLEKLDQKGGGLGGGEYTSGSNAYQQGLFAMAHHQQQLGPVMAWGALTPAPAPAPVPFYGCGVYSPPCIHISRSPKSSRRYK